MTFDKIYQYAFLLLSALWIPFPKLGGIGIALFACVVIYGIAKQELKFEVKPLFLGFIVLYLLYVISVWQGSNLKSDLPFLEFKLSFVIFPLLFSFQPKQKMDRQKILNTYVIACTLLGLLYMFRACYLVFTTGQTQSFHSSWFAYNHHPSYVAAFFSLAIFYLLGTLEKLEGKIKMGVVLLILFLSLLHFPLESMAGILILGSIFLYYFIRWSRHRITKKLLLASVITCIAFVISFLSFQPGLRTDLQNTLQSTTTYTANPQKFISNCPQKMSGNQARLILWTTSAQIISEHPFGVGISGLDIEMSKRLHHLGFHELAAKHWNPHNQYLQITAELGWFGLVWLLAIILALGRLAWQRKDLIFSFLIASFTINCLFESMLQRQSGIVFYLLFLSAFIAIVNPPKPLKA
ncbi:MAG: O-antigen ligase family protein [Flavobacteriales bacterium]